MRNWWPWALAIVVFIAALSTGWAILTYLAYVIVLLFAVANLWTVLNVQGVVIKRTPPQGRLFVGETLHDELLVSNRGWLPRFWLHIETHATLPGYAPGLVVNVGKRATRRFVIETPCVRRGRYRLGPVQVTSSDIFGAFRVRRRFAQTTDMLVLPAMDPITEFTLPGGILPIRRSSNRGGFISSASVAGIRPYLPGDSRNRIHWPASAHTGELMIKELEVEPSNEVWVLVDLDDRFTAGSDLDTTTEMAVRTAASLAGHLVHRSAALGLICGGEHTQVLPLDRGERQLFRILEALAVAEPGAVTNLASLLVGHLVSFGRNSVVIVVTSSPETGWVRAVENLRYHGVRPVVVLVEAATFDPRLPGVAPLVGELAAAGVNNYLVKRGEALSLALASQR